MGGKLCDVLVFTVSSCLVIVFVCLFVYGFGEVVITKIERKERWWRRGRGARVR